VCVLLSVTFLRCCLWLQLLKEDTESEFFTSAAPKRPTGSKPVGSRAVAVGQLVPMGAAAGAAAPKTSSSSSALPPAISAGSATFASKSGIRRYFKFVFFNVLKYLVETLQNDLIDFSLKYDTYFGTYIICEGDRNAELEQSLFKGKVCSSCNSTV